MAAQAPSPIPIAALSGAVPAAAAASKPAGRRLQGVTRGRLVKPPRLVVYGVEGVGKSSFAAGAPEPIFEGAEAGTEELNIQRMPPLECFNDVLVGIDELTTDPHNHKTYVLDTIDWLEPLIHAAVCAAGGKESIEDFGYGKGYHAALDLWRSLLARLDKLRDTRGMAIILLAHCQIKSFKNPEGDDYDRYEMKVHSKAGALVREWSDACLFANYEISTYEKNQKTKAISTKRHLLHTHKTAAFDAKNRYHLPDVLPLEWQAFEDASRASREIAAVVDVLVAQVRKFDPAAALKAEQWLTAKPRAVHEISALRVKLDAMIAAPPPVGVAPPHDGMAAAPPPTPAAPSTSTTASTNPSTSTPNTNVTKKDKA